VVDAGEPRRRLIDEPILSLSRTTGQAPDYGGELSIVTGRRSCQAGALTAAGAAAATVFCCLPFAAGAIGASIAAVGARFAPFRAYLSAISVVLLAYAFHAAYRRPAVRCDDGSCGSPHGEGRRRLILWLVAVLVALLLSAGWWANWIIYWTL
jgi:hypothetical protein